MKEEITKEIKKMKGNLIGIGIDEVKFLDEIEKNKKIELCFLLTKKGTFNDKKFKLNKTGKSKTVNIKKLKKRFRIKSCDNILCNYEIVKKFYKSFIPSSIYITRGNLYLYGNVKELEKIKEKFERYTNDIEIKKNNKSFLMIIKCKDVKVPILKEYKYKIKDTMSDLLDNLTDLLAN